MYIYIFFFTSVQQEKQTKSTNSLLNGFCFNFTHQLLSCYLPQVGLLFLTAHEGSTVCTHAVSCMPLWFAPPSIAIHPLPLCLRLSLSSTDYTLWLTLADALWGISIMKTGIVNHHKHTGHSSLFVPPHCAFSVLHSFCPLVFPSLSLFFCPSAHVAGLVVASS